MATMTQTFYVVNTVFEMGCMVTNVTVHTWRQKTMTKNTSLSSCVNGPLRLTRILVHRSCIDAICALVLFQTIKSLKTIPVNGKATTPNFI